MVDLHRTFTLRIKQWKEQVMLYRCSSLLKARDKAGKCIVSFFHSCWVSPRQYVRRSETGQTISRADRTRSGLWLGSYGQKGWCVVCTVFPRTDADTAQGCCENGSWQLTLVPSLIWIEATLESVTRNYFCLCPKCSSLFKSQAGGGLGKQAVFLDNLIFC